MEIDKKRSMYEKMSIEEKETIKESLRLFRHPKFMRKETDFESDVNGAKERKEGFYSDVDSKPFPSKFRYSNFKDTGTNFENQEKKDESSSRSDSKPEYRHPNPIKTEPSLGDAIKADYENRQRFYSYTESNDQEPSDQSESFVKEVREKTSSFYTNSNAKSAPGQPYSQETRSKMDDDCDDVLKNPFGGPNPTFEGLGINRKSSSRPHEELLRKKPCDS